MLPLKQLRLQTSKVGVFRVKRSGWMNTAMTSGLEPWRALLFLDFEAVEVGPTKGAWGELGVAKYLTTSITLLTHPT